MNAGRLVLFGLAVSHFLLSAASAESISLTGANGRTITVAGIREAVPQGLWLRVQTDGEEIAVAWNKLDLAALETDHPDIHAAWKASQNGSSTLLELGSYERAMQSMVIADVIGKVVAHDAAESHPAADELGIMPYLYESGGGDHPLPFRFFAPDLEIREGDEKLPLIVWLHGAGSGGTNNKKNVNVNLARAVLSDSNSMGGKCCLLYPQFHDEYNWWTYTSRAGQPKRGVPGRQILDLVDEIVSSMPVDGDRIYLMGMSQGGFGIPYLVTSYPNRFAAQVLISGMTRSVPWSRKNVIPSWLYYSHDDPIMHQNGRDLGAEMTETLLGVADEEMIRITTYDTEGHNGPLKRAMEDETLWPWLFDQKNPETPSRDSALISEFFD
ncbi:MAG: PHB depolymerase family esterase [Verrucomicrobiota bacterium]